jgi:hypothetical protein
MDLDYVTSETKPGTKQVKIYTRNFLGAKAELRTGKTKMSAGHFFALLIIEDFVNYLHKCFHGFETGLERQQ